MKRLYILLAFVIVAGGAAAQTQPRIKLTQLEKAKIAGIIHSKYGAVGVTDTAGNQRYQQYVGIRDTCIAYSLTDGGTTTNSNLYSRFVSKCSGDSIWYVDFDGTIKLLSVLGPGGSCDADWYEIGNNLCPDNISDSIYKYKYAAIGARLVWPNAELFVNDSSSRAYIVVQGDRDAATVYYNKLNGAWSQSLQTGSTHIEYLGGGSTTWFWSEASGTATNPVAPFDNHMAIKTGTDEVQLFKYPNTRDDTGAPVNLLNTDASGNVRSDPISAIVANYEVQALTQATNFTASSVTISLSQTPKAPKAVTVDYNGQRLVYNSGFSVSGTTVTILFADPYVTTYDANPVFQVVYQY
jgi:hypothetical protein